MSTSRKAPSPEQLDELIATNPTEALLYHYGSMNPNQVAASVLADPRTALMTVPNDMTDEQFLWAASRFPGVAQTHAFNRVTRPDVLKALQEVFKQGLTIEQIELNSQAELDARLGKDSASESEVATSGIVVNLRRPPVSTGKNLSAGY